MMKNCRALFSYQAASVGLRMCGGRHRLLNIILYTLLKNIIKNKCRFLSFVLGGLRGLAHVWRTPLQHQRRMVAHLAQLHPQKAQLLLRQTLIQVWVAQQQLTIERDLEASQRNEHRDLGCKEERKEHMDVMKKRENAKEITMKAS